MEVSEEQLDCIKKLGDEREYWKQRCLLAENLHRERERYNNPPNDYREAIKAYNKFIEETKEP